MTQPKKPIYITTPIYYVNAEPHLGHTYTTIVADAIKRFSELMGEEAYLLTGTDEHGEKIQQNAAKNNLSPQVFVDTISQKYQAIWDAVGIRYDDFIRTTQERHKKVVRAVLQKIYDQGDISYQEYEGDYCVACERFLKQPELINGKCPEHQKPPQRIKEGNYFFHMKKYAPALERLLTENDALIRPVHYRNEALTFLQEGLEDLCISRPKTRVSWGIELPFDSNFVTYVWFDALLNYISALGWPDNPKFSRWWPGARHIIGKDILKPHALYWPAMLLAMGLPIFQHLDVHGHWLSDNFKMSKTIGNTVHPMEFQKRFGFDALRYFYLSNMEFGADSNFTPEIFLERYRADLSNGLGNLFQRVCAMVIKYNDGKIPSLKPLDQGSETIKNALSELCEEYPKLWKNYRMHIAIHKQWEIFKLADRFIDETKPWELAKNMAQNSSKIHGILAHLLEIIRIQALLFSPVMPQTAETILTVLQCPITNPLTRSWNELIRWGGLPSGKPLGNFTPLFPRVENFS